MSTRPRIPTATPQSSPGGDWIAVLVGPKVVWFLHRAYPTKKRTMDLALAARFATAGAVRVFARVAVGRRDAGGRPVWPRHHRIIPYPYAAVMLWRDHPTPATLPRSIQARIAFLDHDG